ncbi:hypothetical protein MGYG_09122 [Nannizzia gypsea CBS 118893]|uniref:Uncharacterized protein n=1 Tax=Arthroderma gypseum (strain ATCC MYA-4604 / CBS 118893) TaxID=535722 RepID=E4UZ06_ARTGP|nr:hypothetical protein MGYG_09122 [Nannizzia gypsea CBS 118893]EFR03336.1 hypothetical protein MGYG_09122 [Nannizzia gypsea CBS 118893]
MSESLDIPFGLLAFDQFVAENWDPASSLSKHEQKRVLVEKWIGLGKYDRNEYFLRRDQEEYLDYIPRDLLSNFERSSNDSGLSRSFWVRTWYGHKNDKASQDTADQAHQRLWKASIYEGDDDPHTDDFDNPISIFDNREEFAALYEGEDEEIKDGLYVAPADIVPRFLPHILMRCPGILDGESDSPWRHEPCPEVFQDGGLEQEQVLLILIADREACEDGWVLFLAINHLGEILPYRIRDKASLVVQQLADWSDGQQLAEGLLEETIEEYYVSSGDGWASN